MTTYYVSKAGLDVNTGLSGSGAKLTITSALLSSIHDGDIIEILDEGTYAEGDFQIIADNFTLKHTASWLGRPVLSGEGIDANDALQTFDVSGDNATYIGLEIKGYGLGESTGCVFRKGGSVSPGVFHKFHMSGCFIHDCNALGSHYFINNDVDNPSTLKQCTMFFDPYGVYNCIDSTGYMEISNCLITSSTATRLVLNGNAKVTASFSTFINRGVSTKPIVQSGKVINCIITGSGIGIASDDHTYNLVEVSSTPFRNLADDADGSAGTGEFDGRAPDFVDGDAIGTRIEVIESYQIETTSYAYDSGIAFDGIIVDITGSTRVSCRKPDMGCFELLRPIWTEHEDEAYDSFEGDFTINDNKNFFKRNKRTRQPARPYKSICNFKWRKSKRNI